MSDSRSVSRRQFLGRSACNAAGLAAGLVSLTAAASASDSLRIGVIGVRRQGRKLALDVAGHPNASVAALCDVDAAVLDRAMRELTEAGASPSRESDYRRLLDDRSIDAVMIATPDHSHAALAIAAMQAGKDVYIETPVCHAISEGGPLLTAARQTGKIVQTGTFERSLPHVQSAIEFVKSGALGAVPLVKTWAVHRRPAGGFAIGPIEAPSGVDYDAWLSPTPERGFDPNRFHRNWHGFWDYGSGELGLWGASLLDIAAWGLDIGLPERVAASGQRLADGPTETPDTLQVQYVYPQTTVVWEHRQWSNHPPEGRSAGIAFYGDRGTLVLDRGGWKVYDASQAAGEDGRASLSPHVGNFLEAVRTRRQPAAPIEAGINAAMLCHLGNAAYRMGRELRFDAVSNRFVGNAEADALVEARYRPEFRLG